MSKIKWLLAAAGAALIGLAPVLTDATSAGADPGTILKFDTITPLTGPYVDTGNPIRAMPGGGLPWMITAGTGSLTRDGHLLVHVRGLVLADQPPGPARAAGHQPGSRLQGHHQLPEISAAGAATLANVSTAPFPASAGGNSDINATVSLPRPCIAPIVFVTSPGSAWFAATGS
jgi:hypothetical protein